MQRRALVRELARLPGGTTVTCIGRSMEPTVMLGQSVRLRRCSIARLRIGDVVLFEAQEAGVYVLHRIVFIAPRIPWFLHVGDNPIQTGPRRAMKSQIVARADLARKRPPLRSYAAAGKAGFRRLRRILLGALP